MVANFRIMGSIGKTFNFLERKNMKATYIIVLGFVTAVALGAFASTAHAQDSTEPAQDEFLLETGAPTANDSIGGALVGFRASEQLSNPQAWQTNSAGNIRFCYVITQLSNEEGQTFYLEEFQLKCTPWQ